MLDNLIIKNCLNCNNGEDRLKVLEEASTWLGTKYHHRAQIKQAGVDCGMFLYKVFHNCNFVDTLEFKPYSTQWFLNKNEEIYLKFVREHFNETEELLPGNIILYKFGRTYSHGSIIIKWPRIIHAVPFLGVIYDSGIEFSLGTHKIKEQIIFDPWLR